MLAGDSCPTPAHLVLPLLAWAEQWEGRLLLVVGLHMGCHHTPGLLAAY